MLVVESFRVGAGDLERAHQLRIVQKFGTTLRNIDELSCQQRGIKILTIRRRANIACAEHVFALMLMLARRLNELNGVASAERLAAAGHPFRPYDRTHTPGGNFGRFAGLKSLNGQYHRHNRTRRDRPRDCAPRPRVRYAYALLSKDPVRSMKKADSGVTYAPLPQLLAESDWVVPQLPASPSTRGFLGRKELALLKPTAHIINISGADLIDRDALIEALKQRRIAGFALDPLYQEPMPAMMSYLALKMSSLALTLQDRRVRMRWPILEK